MSAKIHMRNSTRKTVLPEERTQWEYLEVNGCKADQMKDFGLEGWELVCVSSSQYTNVFYFKRKILVP